MLIHPLHRVVFFFHVIASLAQMELELLAERTKVGLAAAKAKKRIGGCKRKMTQSKIESAASGSLPKDVAQNLGIWGRAEEPPKSGISQF